MEIIDLTPDKDRNTVDRRISQFVKYYVQLNVKLNLWNPIADLIFVNVSNQIRQFTKIKRH